MHVEKGEDVSQDPPCRTEGRVVPKDNIFPFQTFQISFKPMNIEAEDTYVLMLHSRRVDLEDGFACLLS